MDCEDLVVAAAGGDVRNGRDCDRGYSWSVCVVFAYGMIAQSNDLYCCPYVVLEKMLDHWNFVGIASSGSFVRIWNTAS